MKECTPRRTAEAGFSLLEALVSMSLFLVVLLAVLLTYSPNREIHARSERKVDIQQNARLALADMARQIRMAGYFPENFTTPPVSPLLANPLRIATNDSLAIYGDTNGSGASNIFLYCRDGEFLRRRSGGAATAGSYTCSAGEIIAESVADLQFLYYDANNNPVPATPTAPYQLDGQSGGSIPSLATTTQRNSVRRVVVRLTTREEMLQRGAQIYTLTSDVALRNVN